jgi:hypothetical protein
MSQEMEANRLHGDAVAEVGAAPDHSQVPLSFSLGAVREG